MMWGCADNDPTARHSRSKRRFVSSLSAGAHTLTAEYSGSSNFNPSSSAALLHTVNPLTPFININTSGRRT